MRSREYINAVDEAFEPWTLDWPPGWVECAFKFSGCRRKFPREEIAAVHIYGKKARPELRNEPLNILPGCYFCHSKYDSKPLVIKHGIINALLPGRIPALKRLIKERARVPLGR